MTSVGNTLWPVWMDNSSGIYQIWTCPLDLTALSVQQTDKSVPEELTLRQNYPNPFNPSTTIKFQIAPAVDGSNSSLVTLKVFNMLGEEVATLAEEFLEPGTYSTSFSGDGLASGLYFYRLQHGGSVVTRKMVLMK